MAKAYSLDMRIRILKDYDDGTPIDDLVTHYEIRRSWQIRKCPVDLQQIGAVARSQQRPRAMSVSCRKGRRIFAPIYSIFHE